MDRMFVFTRVHATEDGRAYRAPASSTLRAEFGLTGGEARTLRALLKSGPEPDPELIDRIRGLRGFGWEEAVGRTRRGERIALIYWNRGEMYAKTILRDRRAATWKITSAGDEIERLEARGVSFE